MSSARTQGYCTIGSPAGYRSSASDVRLEQAEPGLLQLPVLVGAADAARDREHGLEEGVARRVAAVHPAGDRVRALLVERVLVCELDLRQLPGPGEVVEEVGSG